MSNTPSASPRGRSIGILITAAVFLLLMGGVSVWIIHHYLMAANQTVVLPPGNREQQTPTTAPVSIGGVVQDESGGGIRNARIRIVWSLQSTAAGGTPRRAPSANKSVTTDDVGRWSASGVPADAIQQISLSHPDYLSQEITASPQQLADHSAVFVLSHGIDVIGKVVDTSGKAIEGAEVTTRQTPFDRGSPTVTTGNDGTFQLHHIPPGGVVLTATARGYAAARQTTSAVPPSTQPGVIAKTTIQIVMPAGITLHGKVVDPQGQPVAGADVGIYFWNDMRVPRLTGRTDGNGNFQLAEALAGSMLYMVDKQGYQSAQDQINGADGEVVIKLTPESQASGTVVDAQTHQPIDKFTVVPGQQPPGRSSPNYNYSEQKDFSGGRFNLALAGYMGEDGPYNVRIVVDGYAPFDSAPVSGNGALGEIALHKAPDIEGHLFGIDGKPLAGVSVALAQPGRRVAYNNDVPPMMPPSMTPPRSVTDAEGSFHFPPQIGSLEFWVNSASGCAWARRDAGDKQPLELHLIPWASVHIHGLPWNDSPTAVYAEAATGRVDQSYSEWEWHCPVGPGGDLIVQHMPPFDGGMTDINLFAPEPRRALQISLIVNVKSGRTTDVDLAHGVTLTGRMSLGSNDSVTGSQVIRLRAVPDRPAARWPTDRIAAATLMPTVVEYVRLIEPDGQFRIPAVAAGAYEYSSYLSAPNGSGKIATGRLHVPAGDASQTVDVGPIPYVPRLRPNPGDPAPETLGRTVDDKPIRTADFGGKYVVWVEWDIYSAGSLPALKRIGDQFGGNTKIALVSANDDMTRFGLPIRPAELGDGWMTGYVSPADAPIADSLYDRYWPTIVIITPDGKIAAKGLTADQLGDKLTALMAATK